MKAETREWVRCAEEDYDVASSQFRRRTKRPTANAIGFHCQQCVEKYFKARLEEANLPIPKVHDLVLLLQRLLTAEPLWASFAPALRSLNDYAVRFRYPRKHCNPSKRAESAGRLPKHPQGSARESEAAGRIAF